MLTAVFLAFSFPGTAICIGVLHQYAIPCECLRSALSIYSSAAAVDSTMQRSVIPNRVPDSQT